MTHPRTFWSFELTVRYEKLQSPFTRNSLINSVIERATFPALKYRRPSSVIVSDYTKIAFLVRSTAASAIACILLKDRYRDGRF